jgi:hypothetical protein
MMKIRLKCEVFCDFEFNPEFYVSHDNVETIEDALAFELKNQVYEIFDGPGTNWGPITGEIVDD